MKFTQVPSQYSKGIGEVKATIKVWVGEKAPSCHVSHESSAALQLFKQWTALLQTIDCRKAWGKQPTVAEQGSPQQTTTSVVPLIKIQIHQRHVGIISSLLLLRKTELVDTVVKYIYITYFEVDESTTSTALPDFLLSIFSSQFWREKDIQRSWSDESCVRHSTHIHFYI
jgi:hypothetical protein